MSRLTSTGVRSAARVMPLPATEWPMSTSPGSSSSTTAAVSASIDAFRPPRYPCSGKCEATTEWLIKRGLGANLSFPQLRVVDVHEHNRGLARPIPLPAWVGVTLVDLDKVDGLEDQTWVLNIIHAL
jgi:hypothetical protein